MSMEGEQGEVGQLNTVRKMTDNQPVGFGDSLGVESGPFKTAYS